VADQILLAASPNCFLEFHPYVAYRYLAALGVRYVEVPCGPGGVGVVAPETMDAEALAAFRARLQDVGVTPITVGAYCDVLRPSHVAALLRRIDFARTLGATTVVSDATRQLEVDADQWRRLVNTLRYVGDYAADQGVRVALETHGGLTRTGALCKKLLDAVDHAAIGVNYDTGNIYYYNDALDPAEDVRQIADRVVHVHLKDTLGGKGEWLFCPLGDGRVDFSAVLGVLRERGFAGPYSLELEGKQGEDNDRAANARVVERSLAYLSSLGLTWDGAPGRGGAAGLQAAESG
jgi:sugar phosphate isomerase/epimerase